MDPASTMQVVNALIKADKDFDLLYMPGAGHGVARTPYGAQASGGFFRPHFPEYPTLSLIHETSVVSNRGLPVFASRACAAG